MKNIFKEAQVEYQLVTPHIHRCNAAEHSVHTYKHHIIAGLYTCDPQFPSREWDWLLPQCNITLDLLRSDRRNPSLSAYESLLGNFDFNKTPMAQIGTKTVFHEKRNNRLSWDGHGTEDWYVGPSMKHYQCFKCYMLVTCREQDADTVEFLLTTTPFPRVSIDNYLQQAATDLADILRAPKTNIPTLTYGSSITNAYIQLAQILKRVISQPTSPTSRNPVASSPRAMPLSPIEIEVSTIKTPQNLTKDNLSVRDKVTAEPRVQKVAHANINSKPLRHLHLLVQNKVNLLNHLRPTKSCLIRVVTQAVHNSDPQSQSVQTITNDNTHWACPVLHPNTGNKLSFDQLLQ